jgi:lipoic acid synthetase
VNILTLGQYLRPSAQHLPVSRFYHPDEFAELAVRGREMGFAHVESGPLVRSSYHAKRQTDSAGRPPQLPGEAQPKASRADQ